MPDSVFEPEKILILVPVITLGTSIFSYLVNTIRNPNLDFSWKEFGLVIGGSIVYSVALGIFIFYFYKIIIEKFWNPIKNFIIRTTTSSVKSN